jgi:putative PIN family toxin of toxin-antitoxin system
MPSPIQVIIDTNVLVAALRSRTGAAWRLFSLISDGRWRNNISPALFLEYEEQAKLVGPRFGYSFPEIDDLLDAIARQSNLWHRDLAREPHLPDPDDDFILDLARGVAIDYIITHNVRDFTRVGSWAKVIVPGAFLNLLRTV